FGNGIVEETCLLSDITFHIPEILRDDRSNLPSVDLDGTAVRIIKAHQKFEKRGFSGTALSMQTDPASLWYGNGIIGEDLFLLVRKGKILTFDRPEFRRFFSGDFFNFRFFFQKRQNTF